MCLSFVGWIFASGIMAATVAFVLLLSGFLKRDDVHPPWEPFLTAEADLEILAETSKGELAMAGVCLLISLLALGRFQFGSRDGWYKSAVHITDRRLSTVWQAMY